MRVSQSIFDRRENMDAQKFGHSVGQFFKKIDRTLSFLPGKPRKAVVTAAALAASPILAGVVISKAKSFKETDYGSGAENKSIMNTLLEFEEHEDGYRDGPEGVGFYSFGTRIDVEDDVDTFEHMNEFYEIK